MRHRSLWFLVTVIAAAAVVLAFVAGSTDASVPSAPAQSSSRQAPHQGPPPPGRPGGRGGPGGPGMGGGLEPMLFELDLTAAQFEQVKALQEAARASSQPYQEMLRQAQEEMRAVIEASEFDESAVRALAAAEAKATIELRVIGARVDAAIYQLLTPAQRATLEQLRKRPGPRR